MEDLIKLSSALLRQLGSRDEIVRDKKLVNKFFKEFLFASHYKQSAGEGENDADKEQSTVVHQTANRSGDKEKSTVASNRSNQAAFDLLVELLKGNKDEITNVVKELHILS